MLFNFIYTRIAYYMNDVENHKSYESYESSLATKIFLFQFVNSFNSLVIIAFLKRSIDFMGGCVKTLQFNKNVSMYNFCDEELENQMITIGIINFVKNFTEIGIPWLMNKWRNSGKKTSNHENILNDPVMALRSRIDYQNNLDDFNIGYVDDTFEDYLELVIQFGSVTLFAMSFSLLPILAFFTNILEIQVDKTKLLFLSKRPNPVSVNSIGNWFYIFEILSFLAIFSNVGILVFTYNNYFELDNYGKVILYMALVFFYIIVKLCVARFIPDVSDMSIEIQNRHIYVIDKNCDGVAQEPIPNKYYKVNLNVFSS